MRFCLLSVAAAAALTGLASAGLTTFDLELNGANVPSGGDVDGTGSGTLSIDDATGEISWSFTYENIAAPTLNHIHVGGAGQTGGVVVNLGVGTSGGPGTLIDSTTAPPNVIEDLLADPEGFYVNVHNSEFPGGAIRSQLLPQAVAPDVLINEIRIDQPGTDNDEYFELVGMAGTSLDGVTYVVIGDGATASGTIEAAIDLSGEAIRESGFFVAAEKTFSLGQSNLETDLAFENSDNVTHLLVTGFTGKVGDDIDVDDDCELDEMPWDKVLDIVSLVEELDGGECFYGPIVGPDGNFVPAHIYRCTPDGTWSIGAFDPDGGLDTPGAENAACEGEVCVGDLNDDGAVDGADLGIQLGQWGGAGSGDLNEDGVVDGSDLGLLLGAWGDC